MSYYARKLEIVHFTVFVHTFYGGVYVKRKVRYISFLPVLCVVLASFIGLATVLSRSVTVMSENRPVEQQRCIVIDAGHGGIDGGATSCTGVHESHMNLQVALCLNDLLQLMGMNTKMIRTTDISVYTAGETIAAKKISDLKQRVRIVEETDNPILVSIHMNYFTDSRYSGPQVFYAPTNGSQELAKGLQNALRQCVAPTNNRQVKPADGIYLMQNVNCPAMLVECGFISNSQENALLNDHSYQQKFSAVMAVYLSKSASCLTGNEEIAIIDS